MFNSAFFSSLVIKKTLLITTLLCTADAFAVDSSQAKDSTVEPKNSDNGLYQVELIVFKHTASTQEERWPNTLLLEYPEKLVFLDDGKQRLNSQQRRIKTLPVISSKNNKIITRLNKSPHYELLYHQLWQQKIASKETASDIVIQSGDAIEETFPLAGSIKLYKGRYLHIQSNLWFVEFNNGISQLSAAPYNTFFNTAEAETQDISPAVMPETADETAKNADTAVNAKPELKQAHEHVEASKLWPLPPLALKNINNTRPSERNDKENKLWTRDIKRIAQIKQHRRMRSNEIHYIDHPLYGIIIEITKPEKE